MKTYYDILGVDGKCGFAELKRAYYTKAKHCHPDLFGGDSEIRNNEFREIVEAFNYLSDPIRRAAYDEKLEAEYDVFHTPSGVASEKIAANRIMDTDYDEILEELIVGNKPPEDATLMTLMLDLERTNIFMMWREARNYYEERRFKAAGKIFEDLVSIAPDNILYRVYLARCHGFLKKYRSALNHYKIALNIGARRDPPQMMFSVKREMEQTRRRKNPWIHRVVKFFFPDPEPLFVLSDEKMIQDTCKSMEKIMKSRDNSRRLLK